MIARGKRRVTMALSMTVCAAVAVGACGGSSSKTAASSPTSGPAGTVSTSAPRGSGTSASGGGTTLAACSRIPKDDASKLFGTPAESRADTAPVRAAQSVCIWGAKPRLGLSFLLQIRTYDRLAFFPADLPGYSSLPGVGDRAVIRVSPGGDSVLISVAKGTGVISVSYFVYDISRHKRGADQKDQLIALVKDALAR